MQILEWKWFNSTQCVGIARCFDEYEKHHVYFIGVAAGFDEAQDVQSIVDWGAKFPIEAGNILFGVKA